MNKQENRVLTIEGAIDIATNMLQSGSAPFIVAHALASDGFSMKQTETIMRWALMTLHHQKK